MDKVEQAVLSGFEPRYESRPGHGTLRWSCCFEPTKRPLPAEFSEVRQVLPVPLYKPGIHPVNAEDNQFRGGVRAMKARASGSTSGEDNAQYDREILVFVQGWPS